MNSDSASPLRSRLGSKEFLSRIVATANALKQTTDLIDNVVLKAFVVSMLLGALQIKR